MQHSSFVQKHSSSATLNLRSQWICFNKVFADTIGLHFSPNACNTPKYLFVLFGRIGIALKTQFMWSVHRFVYLHCVFVWNIFEYNIPLCLSWRIVPVSVRNRRLETCLRVVNPKGDRRDNLFVLFAKSFKVQWNVIAYNRTGTWVTFKAFCVAGAISDVYLSWGTNPTSVCCVLETSGGFFCLFFLRWKLL